MKIPAPLKPGDMLGVCAPSSNFDIEAFKKGVHVLKKMDFEVKVPGDIFKKKRYLAGEDKVRAKNINCLFSDPKIDGIICARGGFGAMRILEHLDWDIIQQNPKPFIGFSDITAVLLSILGETGYPVIHGPNLVSLATEEKQTVESFYRTLLGSVDKIHVTNKQVLRPGKCTGILKGGNIATISHLLGTRFQPDFANTILFLEDIGEPAYKIDRMLTQMKMADLFQGIKGVVIGFLENCDTDEYMEEILFETFEEYNVPILKGLDSGHGRVNLSLSMGREVEMDTKSGSIFWD